MVQRLNIPPREEKSNDIRIYLESADKEDWKTLLPLGIFSGINTNPLLLKVTVKNSRFHEQNFKV